MIKAVVNVAAIMIKEANDMCIADLSFLHLAMNRHQADKQNEAKKKRHISSERRIAIISSTIAAEHIIEKTRTIHEQALIAESVFSEPDIFSPHASLPSHLLLATTGADKLT